MRYKKVVIRTFGDEATERFFGTGKIIPKVSWRNCARVARRKLDMIHYAEHLGDLRSPPNNRLEALKAELEGYYSIRINNQFRVVFQWKQGAAYDVRIMDYHS
jgi:proteic killer suppression protein